MAGNLPNRPSDVPPIDASLRSERLCDDQCHPSGSKALKKIDSSANALLAQAPIIIIIGSLLPDEIGHLYGLRVTRPIGRLYEPSAP